MNQVLILTGPPGAGKSSVAQAICERFDRMIHISVDDLRHWVKAGYRHPWMEDAQTHEQRRMATANAAALARNAVDFRYAAIIDDVVYEPGDVAGYREALAGINAEVQFVTLLPTLEVTLARDASRSDASLPERVRTLHAAYASAIAAGTLPGAVIDSGPDADEWVSADRVQDAISRGLAVFS